MAIDGGGDKESGFRYQTAALQTIDFLVEGKEEIYLDAIRVLQVKKK